MERIAPRYVVRRLCGGVVRGGGGAGVVRDFFGGCAGLCGRVLVSYLIQSSSQQCTSANMLLFAMNYRCFGMLGSPPQENKIYNYVVLEWIRCAWARVAPTCCPGNEFP